MSERTRLLAPMIVAVLLAPAAWAQEDSGADPSAGSPTLLQEGIELVERAEEARSVGESPSPWADPAVETLKIVAAQPGHSPETYFYLGRAYSLAGYPTHAARWLDRYLQTAADSDSEMAVEARTYLFRTYFLDGCAALAAGRGRVAERALTRALMYEPESPAALRKLEAAASGTFDPAPSALVEVPGEGPDAPPISMPKTEVFETFAPRAMTRLIAGDFGGAGADLDRLVQARGAPVAIAALRAAIYRRTGQSDRALERFGLAYADPVTPREATVFSSSVGALGDRPIVAIRLHAPAYWASADLRGLTEARSQVAGFMEQYDVFALGVLQDGLLRCEPLTGVRLALGAGDDTMTPTEPGAPSLLTQIVGESLLEEFALYGFPKAPAGPLALAIEQNEDRLVLSFRKPPVAPDQWGEYAQAMGELPGPTEVEPADVGSIEDLAARYLPLYTRTVREEPRTISVVWMTRNFLQALDALSEGATDAHDVEAMLRASEEHMIFMVTMPDPPATADLATKAELRNAVGDRRRGRFLDEVAESPGLSARSGAYGIAFPRESRSGRDFGLRNSGEALLSLTMPDGGRLRFIWDLPLPPVGTDPEAANGRADGA
ncbi:MAG: hypothetical protein GF320_02240 [Armatimonadia bacterium]|nr:hypothetical protein [Armatimonadia bacterium]